MRRVDVLSAFFFVLLGGLAILEAVRLPKYESFGPGGDFAPFWVGVVLVALGVLLLADTLRRPPGAEAEPLMPSREGRIRIASILGALCAYTFLMDYLGYLLSTFLFIAFLVAALAGVSRRSTLAIAAGSALLFAAVFSWLLQIPLPRGFLPL